MSLTNPNKVITEERLHEFYGEILPYLGGMPEAVAVKGDLPVGSIDFFDATTAPEGWLACDGTTYNITDYPQLANYYLQVHGSKNFYGGNGTTTFKVPDLRGEFLRGTGTNSHTNQGNGAAVGVHQDGTQHISISTSSDTVFGYSGSGEMTEENKDSVIGTRTGRYTGTGNTSNNYVTYYTSRPTNTSFLICVKAKSMTSEDYSTDEKIVGTWIDGKPIYQKTFTGLNISVSTTWQTIGTISSVKDIISIKSYKSADAGCRYYGVLDCRHDGNNIQICTLVSGQTITVNIATIQYTKTS